MSSHVYRTKGFQHPQKARTAQKRKPITSKKETVITAETWADPEGGQRVRTPPPPP